MKKYFLATALLLASLTSSHALLLSFDSSPLNVGTGDALSSAFTLDYAYLETVNGLGDPLPNPSWTIDGSAAPVSASSPTDAGWGASASDALDVRDAPVLFTFVTPVDLSGFSAELDNSPFGNLAPEQITFYDVNDVVLGSISVMQSTPGFVASYSGSLIGVKKILLPTMAFYDNVTLTPVPEPGLSVLTGATGLALFLRRRRQA